MRIQTPRLYLIPYTHDMVTEQHVRWLNDKDVVKYSEQRHVRHDEVHQRTYVHSFVGTPNRIWLICLNDDSSTEIGTITAYRDWPNDVYNLGIMIGEKSLWGQGYGLEAWNAVIEWCFKNNGRKVEAGMMHNNEGMCAICDKSLMIHEGIRFAHFLLGGETQDLLLYGRLKP